jgi:NADH-quinone oxidoreductase subunit K
MSGVFWQLCIFVILLFITGLYCIFATYNLIRLLVGIELLIKAATLLIVAAGFVTGNLGVSQALVITLIVIEVVFIVIATSMVIGLHRSNESLDARKTTNLKG